jgi:hypothetical protein
MEVLQSSPHLPVGLRLRGRPGDSEKIEYWVAKAMRPALTRLVNGINRTLRSALASLRYLGPLRAYPGRRIDIAEERASEAAATGQYAWSALARDPSLLGAVNRWLAAEDRLRTPYQLEVMRMVPLSAVRQLLTRGRSRHPADVRKALADIGARGPAEIRLIDRLTSTAVTHRDVGLGVSQVLPVLVSAFGSIGALIAIEQPEIHLHPALQADLADVFIQTALGESCNTYLLETHSEHLILRVLRRVRETAAGHNESLPPVSPEDVAVIYVEPSREGSVVTEIPIASDGELAGPWPGGFFKERVRELM